MFTMRNAALRTGWLATGYLALNAFNAAATANLPAQPDISPAGGLFYEPVTIAITSDEGAELRLNVQGNDPMTTGQYWTPTAPFSYNVSRDFYVRAYEEDAQGNPQWSKARKADFDFKATSPTISVSGDSVTLSRTDSWNGQGTLVYTTQSGSNPVWTTYNGAFNNAAKSIVRAKVIGIASVEDSDIASYDYTANYPYKLQIVATDQDRDITISLANGQALPQGAEIYFTSNGQDPRSTNQQYSGTFQMPFARDITASVKYQGTWYRSSTQSVAPKTAPPVVTSRYSMEGGNKVQWVSAFSPTVYQNKYADIYYRVTSGPSQGGWQKLENGNCQNSSNAHCGEFKVEHTDFSVHLYAKLDHPDAQPSDEVAFVQSLSHPVPAALRDIQDATASDPKTLIFTSSWVESQTGLDRNKLRIGFAKFYDGQVEYFYQSLSPEQLTSHQDEFKSVYTMPYFKDVIENTIAPQEEIEYGNISNFANNMLALYQDNPILIGADHPRRFRQGDHQAQYCNVHRRGMFTIPTPTESKMVRGNYSFDNLGQLVMVLNHGGTNGDETLTWRATTIQEQFEASQSRHAIEYTDNNQTGSDYIMTEQAPTIRLQDNDQSIALVSYSKGGVSLASGSKVQGFAFASDDIQTAPPSLDLSNMAAQYYGYGVFNDIYAGDRCANDPQRNPETCGTSSSGNIQDMKPTHSLFLRSHNRLQFEHPNNSGYNFTNPEGLGASGGTVYGTIEMCGKYGNYLSEDPNTGNDWDKYLKHCVDHVLFNADDSQLKLNPANDANTASVAMPSTWLPRQGGHIYDNDYLTGPWTDYSLRDQIHNGPYCYDKFETQGGHKTLMLGNWDNGKVTKMVFLEMSFDAMGYPMMAIGKMVAPEYIKAH